MRRPGRYHRDLEAALEPGGHALVKVNPARARPFAQAIGQGAKTDHVDAAMLARMGAVLDLEAKPVRSCSMHEIRELHVARIGLVKDRTACRNRLHGARNKVVLAQLRARLKQVEKQIEQFDAELLRLIAGDPQLARRLEILTDVRPRNWACCRCGDDRRDAGTRLDGRQGGRQSCGACPDPP